MPPKIVEETANLISTMEIRGAGKIGRAAAQTLKDFAIGYRDADHIKFLKELNTAKETLLNTRPTAVSLANALNAVMSGVKGNSVDEIRNGVVNAADKFIVQSKKAVEKIAKMAAAKIKDGDSIMTHCNSTVVVKGIINAHEQDKRIHVFATETRPWQQGFITARALADAGVDVTLIVDSAARTFMTETDLVLVGADTIISNGTVINKIGTSQIALIAHENNVPVFVCAESYKFSKTARTDDQVTIEERDTSEIVEPSKLKGVKLRNPVFDSTPPKYIKAIITEYGIISPSEVREVITKI